MLGFGVKNKALEKRHKCGIPDNANFATYFGTTNTPIYKYGAVLLYWVDPSTIHFCDLNPHGMKSEPIMFSIPKKDIIAFTMTGDIASQTNVKGGGASVGGALVGAAVAGPVGAVIGGRKKVRSETTTLDTRRTFLKFYKDKVETTMQFSDELYNDLCMFCLEKKI